MKEREKESEREVREGRERGRGGKEEAKAGSGERGGRVSFKIGIKRHPHRKFLFIDTTRLSTLETRGLKGGG